MVPRNSSLRAHPADTSTGCAVCVLSSFQRTRSSATPRPSGPAFPPVSAHLLPPRSSSGEPYNLTTGSLCCQPRLPCFAGLVVFHFAGARGDTAQGVPRRVVRVESAEVWLERECVSASAAFLGFTHGQKPFGLCNSRLRVAPGPPILRVPLEPVNVCGRSFLSPGG